MKKTIWLIIVAGALCMLFGCTSKLARIDSKPAFADIRINDEFVGKTPMYHRFYDKWHPWPSKEVDDYVIYASLPGYRPDVQIFQESPEIADISYVPGEIFFELKLISTEEETELSTEENIELSTEESIEPAPEEITEILIEEDAEIQSEESTE